MRTTTCRSYVRNVATVSSGSGAAARRALDKGGAEAVGGVVVVRYGANPLAVIERVKEKIAQIAPGLPRKTLEDGTVSQVTVVPFYDRTGLIYETLGTLNTALKLEEILVTIIVVLVMVGHLRSALLISGLLPLAVLMCFIAMKQLRGRRQHRRAVGHRHRDRHDGRHGNRALREHPAHLEAADDEEDRLEVVLRGASEVGGAVLTAVLTTVVSFLPVFTMEGAEGKLFKPLAFTKTFALLASVVVALTIIPPAAHLLFRRAGRREGWPVLECCRRRALARGGCRWPGALSRPGWGRSWLRSRPGGCARVPRRGRFDARITLGSSFADGRWRRVAPG